MGHAPASGFKPFNWDLIVACFLVACCCVFLIRLLSSVVAWFAPGM